MPFDEAFLKETREVWQPLSATPLTEADCEEIASSMIGLFSALRRCAVEARTRTHKPDDQPQSAPES